MKYEPEDFQSGNLDPEVIAYLDREFRNIAAAFLGVENILLQEMNVEPDKPRDGLVVLADGTNWNPGSGAGYYGFHNSVWVKLG